jgi:hypothetical protein
MTSTSNNETTITSTKPIGLLLDPDRLTITITQAAAILCVSASTAHKHHRRTGYLMDGVPVLRVGRRCVVSTSALRRALGIREPI